MLNIHNTQPRLVYFSERGDHAGYGHDQRLAKRYLVPGCFYDVAEFRVGSFHSYVRLRGFPGVWFNTVQFEEVEGEKPPA